MDKGSYLLKDLSLFSGFCTSEVYFELIQQCSCVIAVFYSLDHSIISSAL
jgi:hypothetical protein